MGQAREVMDRLTTAMNEKDRETLAGCYAADAVASTPDQGELTGRDAIVNYLFHFWDAFPDVKYEAVNVHEAGNVAIDEGIVTGTNTGSLMMPTGENLPPTGKEIRVRSCDIARVEGGEITSHHFYFDQMEFLAQLGLMRELSSH
ncbi:ester cyclase [Pseudarthrobacter sp. NS4]|uniref:ester cyclase n=1 Tax=Pseudarthrobacter sp. NS4 TaxID=2973976 RepID=UPI0021612AFF|nr:nuclear transport factor 2 family protein [Pseudarthrobacter sp. NS4]